MNIGIGDMIAFFKWIGRSWFRMLPIVRKLDAIIGLQNTAKVGYERHINLHLHCHSMGILARGTLGRWQWDKKGINTQVSPEQTLISDIVLTIVGNVLSFASLFFAIATESKPLVKPINGLLLWKGLKMARFYPSRACRTFKSPLNVWLKVIKTKLKEAWWAE